MTDEAGQYNCLIKHFASHGYVCHRQFKWGRCNVHTNTVVGFYSVFKRGMKGVYQHCALKHLHRNVAEFDFRNSQRAILVTTGQDSTQTSLRGITDKRLIYKTVDRSKS
jgi:hypothetical protein